MKKRIFAAYAVLALLWFGIDGLAIYIIASDCPIWKNIWINSLWYIVPCWIIASIVHHWFTPESNLSRWNLVGGSLPRPPGKI